ncbi:MAG: 50S ribosomal protein L7ae [Candidatus Heimdallarchaeota archaeon]|nr:50S ribosomal protein L7ae [Candidatus Heimdallarchaeota archaeon]
MSEQPPTELIDDTLSLLQTVRDSGKIKRGTNEVTKAIERGKARLVLIGGDVSPAEIVRHLPILAKEKNVAYLEIPESKKLGKSAGIEVGAASVAIIDAGKAEADLKSIVERVKQFN